MFTSHSVSLLLQSCKCLHHVSGVFNISFQQFYKLFQSASTNSNVLVCTVFHSAVRELREKSLFVWGVRVAELNC